MLSQIAQALFVLSFLFLGFFGFGDDSASGKKFQLAGHTNLAPSFDVSDSNTDSLTDEVPKEVKQARDSIWSIGYLFPGGLIIDKGAGVFIAPDVFLTDFHVMLSLLRDNDISSVRLSKKESSETLKIDHIQALSSHLVLIKTEKPSQKYLKIQEGHLGNPSVSGYLAKDSLHSIGSGRHDSHFFYAGHSVFSGLIGSPVLDQKGQIIDIFHKASGNTLKVLHPGYLQVFIQENRNKDINCRDFSCIEQEMANIKRRADAGSPMAQFEWAYILREYLKDDKKAFRYMSDSAGQHFTLALFYLGDMYNSNRGVERDREKALECFENAAELGLVQAQNRSAYLHYHRGNIESALKWWEKAVEQNSAQAKYNLADAHLKGESVEQDSQKAYELLLSAAKQGLPQAQNMLAVISPNIDESLEWEEKAIQWRTSIVE